MRTTQKERDIIAAMRDTKIALDTKIAVKKAYRACWDKDADKDELDKLEQTYIEMKALVEDLIESYYYDL